MSCYINWDYIGHIENLQKEFRHLAEKFFPDIYLKNVTLNNAIYRRHLDSVPVPILNSVAKLYSIDFEMFAYDADPVVQNMLKQG